MRRWFYGFWVGGLLAQGALASSAAQPAVALEPEPAQWKGKPYENVLQIGFMPGLGLLGSRVGLGLNGAVSVLAARNGFIDDINGWDFAANSARISDVHGHGTHISGIIGAEAGNGKGISGIAPKVSLMIAK